MHTLFDVKYALICVVTNFYSWICSILYFSSKKPSNIIAIDTLWNYDEYDDDDDDDDDDDEAVVSFGSVNISFNAHISIEKSMQLCFT